MHTHTHARMHACTHKNTPQIHTQKAKPSTAMLVWSRLPSEPALGYLCTTQVLGVSTGKSSWDRTSNLQEAVPCPTGESVGIQSHT